MKRHEQPKIGMWLRQAYYGTRFGKIVYNVKDSWVVRWHPLDNHTWVGCHEGLGIHTTRVLRRCRVVSRKDAKAEIVMHQLAR